MKVVARAPLFPTEDADRVAQAVARWVDDADVAVEDERVQAVGDGVHGLRRRVWEQRIIDTFRSVAEDGVSDERLRIVLDKQAAIGGQVAFPIGGPALGAIVLECRLEDGDPWSDAAALVAWIAPPTEDGRVVGASLEDEA